MIASAWSATPIYIATNGSDAAAGTTWATAVRTFAQAIALASDPGEIIVSNGTYTADGSGTGGNPATTTNMVYINKGLTIRSFKGRDLTILSGGNIRNNRLVHFAHSNAVLDGFTLTRGSAYGGDNQDGGGFFVYAGNMITNCIIAGNENSGAYIKQSQGDHFLITDCIFSNNYGKSAGGLWHNLGKTQPLTISNCLFSGNVCTGGNAGAVALVNPGGGISSFYFNNCVISNNTSSGGSGGIYMPAPFTGHVENCTFIGNRCFNQSGIFINAGVVKRCHIINNTATNSSGGIYLGANAVMTDTEIIGNTAAGVDGGGGSIYGTMSNCVVAGNTASRWGGGLIVYNSARIINCTITNNGVTTFAGDRKGGGIYVYAGATDVQIRGCLVAGNYGTRSDPGGGIYINSTNATIQNCTIVSNFMPSGNCGGIYLGYTAGVSVVNSVIYSNAATDVGGAAGYTNQFVNSCSAIVLPPAQGNITNNPQFANWAGADYRLAIGSSCVNAGANQAWMENAVDLAGHARIDHFNRIVDMGAYETVYSGTLFLIP
jgi:hypothetical protein